MPKLPRGLLPAVLAGGTLAVAAPPGDLPGAAFAFAPLLYLALRAGPLAVGRGFGLGLAAGFVFSLVAIAWAVPLVMRFGGLSWPAAVLAYLALGVWEGLPPALGCALAATASRDERRLVWALPFALALAFSTVPVLFPWRPGHMAIEHLALVQVVDLGGLGLLDLVLGLVGCGVARALVERRTAPALVAGLVLVAALAYGHLRIPVVEAARRAAQVVRVGVVQPDVRIEEGLDPRNDDVRAARLRAMTVALEREGAELVVWPEAAYPYELDREQREDRLGPSRIRRDGVRGPVIFGAMTARRACERWNSVIAMDEKGRFVDRADKIRLFPFAEFVPLWHVLPPLRARFPCPGLVPGRDLPLLAIGGVRVGLLNCYEDVTDAHALALAPHDPELLVNTASDAWYGDSAQPHLHHRVSRFRAIELRRDLVRALNTGESSHTSATGEDLVVLPVNARGSFVAEVPRLRGRSVYAAIGDVVSFAAMGVLLAFALERRRARY